MSSSSSCCSKKNGDGTESEARKEKMTTMEPTDVHKMVREAYANRVSSSSATASCCSSSSPSTATATTSCCGPSSSSSSSSSSPEVEVIETALRMSCCSPRENNAGDDDAAAAVTDDESSALLKMGYTKEDLVMLDETLMMESNLGLGCGAPLRAARVQNGETVLDLGSGAGFDAFLAASQVGSDGRVIGVDMTPEMIERANRNAKLRRQRQQQQDQGGTQKQDETQSKIFIKDETKQATAAGTATTTTARDTTTDTNTAADVVEFRLGYIEDLPVESDSVDCIISNCVINLSPDKPAVFAESSRVLKPGGRLAVSDIVLLKPLPEAVQQSLTAYVGCIAGASLLEDYLDQLVEAGFDRDRISYTTKPAFDVLCSDDPLVRDALDALATTTTTMATDAEQKDKAVDPWESIKNAVVSSTIVAFKS